MTERNSERRCRAGKHQRCRPATRLRSDGELNSQNAWTFNPTKPNAAVNPERVLRAIGLNGLFGNG